MKNYRIIISFNIMIMLIIITCNIVRDSPLDELGSEYEEPTITIDSLNSSVLGNDTIHSDSAKIVLLQTQYEREFRFRYSDSVWNDWTDKYFFFMKNLRDTTYKVYISTKYKGGEAPVSDSISFTVLTHGYKPVLNREDKDTIIKIVPGKPLKLSVSISLVVPVSYTWLKSNGSQVGTESTLLFTSVIAKDTGTYHCVVSNKYGKAESRHFMLLIDSTYIRPHRIYYFANNATAGTTPQDNNLYYTNSQVTLLGNIGGLYKDSLQFAGWIRIVDKDTIPFSSGEHIIMDSVDMNFYAWWTKAPVYTITYKHNNSSTGTVPIDKNNYIEGGAVTILGNTGQLERVGYIFAGWYRDTLQGSKHYSAGDTALFGPQNLVLFAVWDTLSRFNVAYKAPSAERGSVPVDNSVYHQGDIVYVKDNTDKLTRKGYTHTGWSKVTDDNAKLYRSGDTIINVKSDLTLYASWSSQRTFSITYNSNTADSGFVPTDENNYITGTTAIVKNNTGNLKKSGYEFFGWNIQADGLGAMFKPEARLEINNANISLYAIWTTKPTYILTYITDSSVTGIAPIDGNRYIQGDSVVIRHPGSINKNGYSFTGWNTDPTGNGTTLNPGTNVLIQTSNISLYAQWRLNRYEILYISNNSIHQKDSINHGNLLTAPIKPVRTGFTFSGWFKDASFSEEWDFANTTVTRNTTLYAAWTSTFYTVQFYSGTDLNIPSQAVLYGGKISIPDPEPGRTGYNFDGWFTDTLFTLKWDFLKDTVVSNLILYAKWTKKQYSIRFVFQNGQNDSVASVVHGDTIKKPSPPPLHEGYTFTNWYPPISGGNPWNFATPVTMPCTLFALWDVKIYPVTFIAQNGTPANSTSNTNHGDTIAKPANPVRTGYDFEKWYGDPLFATPWNFKTTVTHPCTLYGQWTIKKYQVIFNTLGGSSFTPVLISHGSTVTRPDSTPKLQGYKFDNWYQDAAGTTEWNFSTNTITAKDTLFAKWTIESYRVLFNKQGGGTNDSQLVIYNQKVNEPVKPEYSGYTFGGWFTDRTYTKQWSFSADPVTGPLILYARWLPCSFVLPEIADLTENPKLPDPFKFLNGTRMTRKSEWGCRRAEILAMAQKYIYGPTPSLDSTEITGTVSDVSINASVKYKSTTQTITFSTSGSGDILNISYGSGIAPSGCRTLNINNTEMDSYNSIITGLYGTAAGCRTMAAVWAVNILCAVINQNPAGGINPKKIMTSGCSAGGKCAFVTGAFCEGIDLTVIVESGGIGASSYRMAEWFKHGAGSSLWMCTDAKPQNLDNTDNGPFVGVPYFSTTVASWVASTENISKVTLLPYDQHCLLACIAPRALCHITNQNGSPNEWCLLGGTCEALSAWAAEPVWNALGVPENFGFLMYTESSAPDHCSKPASATILANEFFKRVFQGNASANTDVMQIRDTDLQQPQADWPAMWKNWDTPVLQ